MAELATIARPYAEALFEVARKGDLNQWAEQVDALAQIASDETLRQFADNPKVSESDGVRRDHRRRRARPCSTA